MILLTYVFSRQSCRFLARFFSPKFFGLRGEGGPQKKKFRHLIPFYSFSLKYQLAQFWFNLTNREEEDGEREINHHGKTIKVKPSR